MFWENDPSLLHKHEIFPSAVQNDVKKTWFTAGLGVLQASCRLRESQLGPHCGFAEKSPLFSLEIIELNGKCP